MTKKFFLRQPSEMASAADAQIVRSFSGRVAQAIQHEIAHCDGVLI